MATPVDNQNKSIKAALVQIYGDSINTRYPLNGSVVHLGRALNAHVRVNAISVSRMHCDLKKIPEGWALKDCGSQNGTFLNGQRLQREELLPLKFGDIIFLGPPSEYPIAFSYEDISDQYDILLQTIAKDEESEILSVARAAHSSKDSQSQNTAKLQNNHEDSNTNILLNKDKSPSATQQVCSAPSSSTNNGLKQNSVKMSKSTSIASRSKSSKYLKKSDRCSQLILDNHEEGLDSQSLLDVENDMMLDVDADLLSQGVNINVSEETENHKSANGQNLDSNSNDLKSRLAVLSKQIEKLEKSKSDLLKEYVVACEKNKLLDQQLAEQKKFSEDMHMYEQRLKNQFKDQIMGQLEEDLICNICTELLIKPIVLDCSHTFCEYCIKEWKRKKKQCPVCRNHIRNETRVLALDHFIDKTLETLTPEQKETRRQIILQREQRKVSTPTTGKKIRRRRSVRYRMHNSRPRQIHSPPNDIELHLMFAVSPLHRNTERAPLIGGGNIMVPEIVISDENSSGDEMDF